MTTEQISIEIPSEEFGDHALKVLNTLFLKAKSIDEFEYACALLRIRGLEGPGWDPLKETHRLIADMMGLMNSPLLEDTKVRLALLTYCHLTEVDAIYGIIKNMLNVLENARCRVDPFWHLYRSTKKGEKSRLFGVIPPSAKTVVNDLQDHAIKLGEKDIATLLKEMFDDAVRNSFYHSDYIIYQDEFRSQEGRFRDGNVISHVMKISKLVELINKGLGFYQAFMQNYISHIRSYSTPKEVTGRILHEQSLRAKITLMADETRGLYGFQSISSDIVETSAIDDTKKSS